MKTICGKYVLATALLIMLFDCLMLSGCPQDDGSAGGRGADATADGAAGDNGTDDPRGADAGVAEGEDKRQPNEVDPQLEVKPLSNPKPSGDEWVWSEELSYRVGEQIRFEYKSKGQGGTPIAVLIRSEIDPLDWTPAQLLAEAYYEPVAGDGGKGTLIATDDGEWRIVLFSDKNDTTSVIAESAPITISEWAKGGSDSNGEPPYLTLGVTDAKEIALNLGVGVNGYYELAEPYAKGAWIGLIPADVDNPLELYNRAQALTIQPLSGQLKGIPAPLFMLDTPGRYVLRIFPSDQPGCEWSLESQPFSVVKP